MLKRLILALGLALAVACPAAFGTWTQKNMQTGYTQGQTSSQSTAAFSNALTNPSQIWVMIVDAGGGTPYTISDTAGNSYVDAGPGVILFNSSGAWSEVFYALNTHTTASNVVKLSPASGLLNYPRIVAVEFTGGATSSPVDGGSGVGYSSKANATGGSSGANCLTATQLTPVTNGDLILAWFSNSNGSVTAGTSPIAFTDIGGGVGGESEYYIQSTAAAITPSAGDNTSSDPYAAIVVAFKPASTGNQYTRTASETNTASDTISRLASLQRTDSETNVASDAIARSQGWVRADSETNVASDAIVRKVSFGRGDTESNPASDLISRLAVFGRSDSESNIASDSLWRLTSFGRADSESNTASDAIQRGAVYGRGESESNVASDSLARLGAFGRSDSENSTASDAIARSAVYGRGDSETNSTADSLARLASFGRGDSESNTASDAVTSLETVPGTYSAALYETNTISDTVAIAQVLNRSDSESNTTSDLLTRAASFGRGDNEALSANDNLRRVLAASRGDTEALSTSASLSRIFAARRGDMETLVFSDAIVGLRNYSLTVLPRHEFAVPGQAKTGAEAGRVKSGTAPVH